MDKLVGGMGGEGNGGRVKSCDAHVISSGQCSPDTYQCLDHACSLLPDGGQTLLYVHGVRHAPYKVVQDDEGPRPPHASATVDHHGGTILSVFTAHTLDEANDGGGVVRHPVVWPTEELEVGHPKRLRTILNGEQRYQVIGT